jgi:ferredoxin
MKTLLSAGLYIGLWKSEFSFALRPTLLHRTTRCFAKLHSDNELDSVIKHTVTWLTEEPSSAENTEQTISFDAYDGEILRTVALRNQMASPHNGRANLINCRGLGTCGTCAVEIVKGQVVPSERNAREQLRFTIPPHNFHNNTKLRLACQIQVKSDVQILKRTGFWGQKDSVAIPSRPQLYFGDLEYLLDSKSPEESFAKNDVINESK